MPMGEILGTHPDPQALCSDVMKWGGVSRDACWCVLLCLRHVTGPRAAVDVTDNEYRGQ